MFVKNYVFNESILFTFPANGEIWVFNRSYTQYIPLSLYDLQSWMGSPSIFVYDCSNAGIIVNSFEQFAEQHERDYQAQVSKIIFYKVVHSCCFFRIGQLGNIFKKFLFCIDRSTKTQAKENLLICQLTFKQLL